MAFFLALVQRVKSGLLRFLQLQLYLNLCSLPILVSWGLPISVLAPVGNYIFNPFLIVFLFIASLVFFCELIAMPNGLLIKAMEFCARGWMRVMPAASSWLVGCVSLPWWLILSIPGVATVILFNKYTRSYGRSIACFLVIFCAVYGYSYYKKQKTCVQMPIACSAHGAVTVIQVQGKLVVIDPGYIGARGSAASWLSYTMAPQIIKATGNASIDYLILLQPSFPLFIALSQLYSVMNVRTIFFVPWADEAVTKRAWGCLRAAAENGHIVWLHEHEYRIALGKGNYLIIAPLGGMGENKKGAFPFFGVRGLIDKHEITIYPAKMKSFTKKEHNDESFVGDSKPGISAN